MFNPRAAKTIQFTIAALKPTDMASKLFEIDEVKIGHNNITVWAYKTGMYNGLTPKMQAHIISKQNFESWLKRTDRLVETVEFINADDCLDEKEHELTIDEYWEKYPAATKPDLYDYIVLNFLA